MLRKLDSSAPARQKTLEILGSLAKRVRSEASVPIPVASVLEIWAGPDNGTAQAPSDLLKTMGMVFVEMGIARMNKDETSKLVPLLVRGIGAPGHGPWKSAVFGVFLSVGCSSQVI